MTPRQLLGSVLLVLALVGVIVSCALSPSAAEPTGIVHVEALVEQPPVTRSAASETGPPKKAYDLLTALQDRQGVPLPGYVGGRDFQNRERHLPRGQYREYDVNPKIRGHSRDAERIVIEQRTGKAYYTSDHYRTFIPLN